MVRQACRWATSSLSRFVGAVAVIHAAAACSAQDRMNAWYTVRRSEVAAPQSLPLRAFSAFVRLFILTFSWSMCCMKVSILSNVTPSRVGVSRCRRRFGPRLSWASLLFSSGSNVKIVAVVFSRLISTFHSLAHFSSSSKATWTFLKAQFTFEYL